MTVKEADPLIGDLLAQRLTGLVIAVPDGLTKGLDSRQHRAFARRRWLRRTAWIAASLAGLTAGNLGGAALVPAYARALASAPGVGLIAGPALRAAGIHAADVVSAEDTATVAGFTAKLTGAYTDGLRTTLFVSLPGDIRVRGSGPYLTDQFGERYAFTGGIGVGVGPFPIHFEPPRGRAAIDGMRFTFHLTVVDSRSLSRDLTLRGTLSPGWVRALTPPPSISRDGTTYAITGIRVSATAVEIDTRITGALIDAAAAKDKALREHPIIGGGVTLPGVYLVTSDGAYAIPIASSQGDVFAKMEQTGADTEGRVFAKGPGPWMVVVSLDDPKPGARALASWTLTDGR